MRLFFLICSGINNERNPVRIHFQITFTHLITLQQSNTSCNVVQLKSDLLIQISIDSLDGTYFYETNAPCLCKMHYAEVHTIMLRLEPRQHFLDLSN